MRRFKCAVVALVLLFAPVGLLAQGVGVPGGPLTASPVVDVPIAGETQPAAPSLDSVIDAPTPPAPPQLTVNVGGKPMEASTTIQILIVLTLLSLAPALLIMVTSFTRIVVVLSFLRQALGTQQTPPNQVIVGLSLFLTLFVMSPVWDRVNNEAIQPFLAKKVDQTEALRRAHGPVREFMLRQVREKDLALFVEMSKIEAPKSPKDVPIYVVIPAFMVSELRIAFQIGFLVYLPFLIIDIAVASILLSMGMLMLPPVLVSLPFKLILFVLADGWHLVVVSLVKSFV